MCVVKPLQDHDQHLQRHVKTENERGRENHRTPDVTKRVPVAARSLEASCKFTAIIIRNTAQVIHGNLPGKHW